MKKICSVAFTGHCSALGSWVLLMVLTSLSWSCKEETQIEPQHPIKPDTTSHTIVWEKTLLGEAASSYLTDVSIANDTAAYAVGVIFLKDSLGQTDPLPYNFARWNGRRWTAERQATRGTLSAVYAFSPIDYWVAGGNSRPQHWNGVAWDTYQIPGAPKTHANRFWGKNSHDMYMVGDSGFVAHFDGVGWTRIPTGTTMAVRDIWGSQNQTTGLWEVLAVASNQYDSPDRKIFLIEGLTAREISSQPLRYPVTTAWFVAGERYYIAGSGIFQKTSLEDSLWQAQLGLTPNYTEAMRGNALNDVVAVGDFGDVLHFSGKSWKTYIAQTGLGYGLFEAVAIRGNLIVAVGDDYRSAVMLIGRRAE